MPHTSLIHFPPALGAGVGATGGQGGNGPVNGAAKTEVGVGPYEETGTPPGGALCDTGSG